MEWEPPSINWSKIRGEDYSEYKNIPNIEYKINKLLLYKGKTYNKEYKDTPITKVFSITDKYNSGICVTNKSIKHEILENINKYYNNKKNIFRQFTDLLNIKAKLIKCYKNVPIYKMNNIRSSLISKYLSDYEHLQKHHKKYIRYYKRDYYNTKKTYLAYILKLNIDKICFITYSTVKITKHNKEKIEKQILSNFRIYKEYNWNIEILDTIRYHDITGLHIMLDKYIIDNNAHNNKYFYILINESDKALKKRVFLNIQQEYIKNYITDVKYQAYKIINKITNESYIESSQGKSLKELLDYLYEMAHTETSKEIYIALTKYKFIDFIIENI